MSVEEEGEIEGSTAGMRRCYGERRQEATRPSTAAELVGRGGKEEERTRTSLLVEEQHLVKLPIRGRACASKQQRRERGGVIC